MCDKCIELDKKIDRYKSMQSRVTDKITLAGLAELIAELVAEKLALHPENQG